MQIDALIEQYVGIKNQRSQLAAQDKELSQQATKLQADIMHAMSEAGTYKAATAGGHSVSMVKKVHPAIVDWTEFYNYVAETGNFDLLQKRLSAPAFRDRWDAGTPIPGAGSTEVWELSISQSRK